MLRDLVSPTWETSKPQHPLLQTLCHMHTLLHPRPQCSPHRDGIQCKLFSVRDKTLHTSSPGCRFRLSASQFPVRSQDQPFATLNEARDHVLPCYSMLFPRLETPSPLTACELPHTLQTHLTHCLQGEPAQAVPAPRAPEPVHATDCTCNGYFLLYLYLWTSSHILPSI